MSLLSGSSYPGLARALVASVVLMAAGYAAELVGQAVFAPLRSVGMVLGFVGVGVFMVAGVLYLGKYLGTTLSDLFG